MISESSVYQYYYNNSTDVISPAMATVDEAELKGLPIFSTNRLIQWTYWFRFKNIVYYFEEIF